MGDNVLPPSQETSAVCLELDNQVCDPDVSVLLQLGQNTSTEKDLGLTNPKIRKNSFIFCLLECFFLIFLGDNSMDLNYYG